MQKRTFLSIYKRGINYVNIPTTLIGMIDASIGGKTALNIDHVKNQIGTFYEPKMVVVDPIFIKTLSKKEYQDSKIEGLHLGDYFFWDEEQQVDFIKDVCRLNFLAS